MSRYLLVFVVMCSFVFSLGVKASPDNEQGSEATTQKVNAAFWLTKLKNALTQSQFQAGIVTLKGEKTESFQWLHGVLADGVTEIEQISPLIGGGVTTIRRGDTVGFIEPNKEPFAMKSSSIRNFIPPIFYKDVAELSDSYQFVLVSKSQIAGRSAQLIRIESIRRHTYNYWVWIDVQSGLPLRLAFVDEKGDVKEQVLMTHLTMNESISADLEKLANVAIPTPSQNTIAQHSETNNWQMSWLPHGFSLLKSDRHHVSISREVSDYYLYSDGLVEMSIYIQRPLESFNSPIVLQDGATSFVMYRSNGFDVTVVGKIPPEVAIQVAKSVEQGAQ